MSLPSGYIPIASMADFKAIGHDIPHTFAEGTEWEVTTNGGMHRSYYQVQNLDWSGETTIENLGLYIEETSNPVSYSIPRAQSYSGVLWPAIVTPTECYGSFIVTDPIRFSASMTALPGLKITTDMHLRLYQKIDNGWVLFQNSQYNDSEIDGILITEPGEYGLFIEFQNNDTGPYGNYTIEPGRILVKFALRKDFSGVYDGGSYKWINMEIGVPVSESIFGHAINPVIRNIEIEDPVIDIIASIVSYRATKPSDPAHNQTGRASLFFRNITGGLTVSDIVINNAAITIHYSRVIFSIISNSISLPEPGSVIFDNCSMSLDCANSGKFSWETRIVPFFYGITLDSINEHLLSFTNISIELSCKKDTLCHYIFGYIRDGSYPILYDNINLFIVFDEINVFIREHYKDIVRFAGEYRCSGATSFAITNTSITHGSPDAPVQAVKISSPLEYIIGEVRARYFESSNNFFDLNYDLDVGIQPDIVFERIYAKKILIENNIILTKGLYAIAISTSLDKYYTGEERAELTCRSNQSITEICYGGSPETKVVDAFLRYSANSDDTLFSDNHITINVSPNLSDSPVKRETFGLAYRDISGKNTTISNNFISIGGLSEEFPTQVFSTNAQIRGISENIIAFEELILQDNIVEIKDILIDEPPSDSQPINIYGLAKEISGTYSGNGHHLIQNNHVTIENIEITNQENVEIIGLFEKTKYIANAYLENNVIFLSHLYFKNDTHTEGSLAAISVIGKNIFTTNDLVLCDNSFFATDIYDAFSEEPIVLDLLFCSEARAPTLGLAKNNFLIQDIYFKSVSRIAFFGVGNTINDLFFIKNADHPNINDVYIMGPSYDINQFKFIDNSVLIDNIFADHLDYVSGLFFGTVDRIEDFLLENNQITISNISSYYINRFNGICYDADLNKATFIGNTITMETPEKDDGYYDSPYHYSNCYVAPTWNELAAEEFEFTNNTIIVKDRGDIYGDFHIIPVGEVETDTLLLRGNNVEIKDVFHLARDGELYICGLTDYYEGSNAQIIENKVLIEIAGTNDLTHNIYGLFDAIYADKSIISGNEVTFNVESIFSWGYFNTSEVGGLGRSLSIDWYEDTANIINNRVYMNIESLQSTAYSRLWGLFYELENRNILLKRNFIEFNANARLESIAGFIFWLPVYDYGKLTIEENATYGRIGPTGGSGVRPYTEFHSFILGLELYTRATATIENNYTKINVTNPIDAQASGLIGTYDIYGSQEIIPNRLTIKNFYYAGSLLSFGEFSPIMPLESDYELITEPRGDIHIISSYWDNELLYSDSPFGTPRPTEEMKKQIYFIGWDFNTIWGLRSAANDGYPFLRASGMGGVARIVEEIIETIPYYYRALTYVQKPDPIYVPSTEEKHYEVLLPAYRMSGIISQPIIMGTATGALKINNLISQAVTIPNPSNPGLIRIKGSDGKYTYSYLMSEGLDQDMRETISGEEAVGVLYVESKYSKIKYSKGLYGMYSKNPPQ